MMGGPGAIFTFDDRPGQVSKLPYRAELPTANVEVEKRIYRRLGEHPNIIGCVGIDEKAIHLELAKYGCLHQYFKQGGTATLGERVRWSRDVAVCLAFPFPSRLKVNPSPPHPSQLHNHLSTLSYLQVARLSLCDDSRSHIRNRATQSAIIVVA